RARHQHALKLTNRRGLGLLRRLETGQPVGEADACGEGGVHHGRNLRADRLLPTGAPRSAHTRQRTRNYELAPLPEEQFAWAHLEVPAYRSNLGYVSPPRSLVRKPSEPLPRVTREQRARRPEGFFEVVEVVCPSETRNERVNLTAKRLPFAGVCELVQIEQPVGYHVVSVDAIEHDARTGFSRCTEEFPYEVLSSPDEPIVQQRVDLFHVG